MFAVSSPSVFVWGDLISHSVGLYSPFLKRFHEFPFTVCLYLPIFSIIYASSMSRMEEGEGQGGGGEKVAGKPEKRERIKWKP